MKSALPEAAVISLYAVEPGRERTSARRRLCGMPGFYDGTRGWAGYYGADAFQVRHPGCGERLCVPRPMTGFCSMLLFCQTRETLTTNAARYSSAHGGVVRAAFSLARLWVRWRRML